MKPYFLRKRIFACLFLAALFAFSGFNFYQSYGELAEVVTEQVETQELNVPAIESEMTSELLGRMDFIETYGFAQKLMGKNEYNNFAMIKDKNGFLHYASFYRERDDELFTYALRVKRLQDYVERNGTKVLFVVAPSKYDPKEVTFSTGIPVNDPDAIVNELLFDLNRLGVETLNLKGSVPNGNVPYEEAFFKTDHHWTVPAAYEATGLIVDKLNESFDAGLDPDGYYTGGESYTREKYYGGMLGYMGRKTGAAYAGVDDFTALWPNFTGEFVRDSLLGSGKTEHYHGTFEEAFMDRELLTNPSSIYSNSQYALYLNELRDFEQIVNKENKEGCRILMIRDSYFSPVIAFLMPMCGEIDAIWSLEASESLDIETYVRENEFDYVIIGIYPYNINGEAFRFFEED